VAIFVHRSRQRIVRPSTPNGIAAGSTLHHKWLVGRRAGDLKTGVAEAMGVLCTDQFTI